MFITGLAVLFTLPSWIFSFYRDHPRIRGTNKSQKKKIEFFLGSSPHTRDKFCGVALLIILIRIIPAYAGQIPCANVTSPTAKDHPRIRGTNGRLCFGRLGNRGSSPHTRDKCRPHSSMYLSNRIIPAYAGQMGISEHGESFFQDHPRIRGTNKK